MSTQAFRFSTKAMFVITCLLAEFSVAQINVTTFHYDNARTGQNTNETVLTPANVNSTQFGKLFSVALDGYVYAQPLYLPNVTISGAKHNVLYVATEHDSVYAIDADSGALLWQQSFINPAAGITTASSTDVACSDLVPEIGITSTPVINPASGTIYVLAKTKENGSYVQRLHALDVITHAEKFGGPKVIAATFSGRTFDPYRQANRPGLLLENGHIVIAWASHCDKGPYQGWVMSYSASTLAQEGVFNTELNAATGFDGGIWMSGDGVASDANGNLYLATGNGSYNGTNQFGDSILKLTGPANGTFSVADWFTPLNQSSLNGGDTDLGSGGLLLLPNLPTGQQLLVQMGKEGKIYLLDRNNMGKFCSTCTSIDTNIVQEIPGASTGIWGSPAFWNNRVFWGGGNDGGNPDHIKAWSFNANNSGVLSTSPVAQSSQLFSFSTAAPVISANGLSNGILWILDNGSFASSCCQALYAFRASDSGTLTMLYNSNQAAGSRDVPGGAVKFTAPVVANGKVYVGSQTSVSAFGILNSAPPAAAPSFSPGPGTYAGPVTVTLSDTTPGAIVHCTTNGSTPTASSPVCTSITISSTALLQAIAVASGFSNSAVTSGTYSIGSSVAINYGGGFSSTGLAVNGRAAQSATRLRLTDGRTNEAGSAYFTTPVDVRAFTTDFSFQLTNPSADGITFVLQNVGTSALGVSGGGLGYGSGTTGIKSSIAVKFDLFSNSGEGSSSTGLYLNGAAPTVPAINLGGGVWLHNGHVFNVHMVYDGTTLSMTITDASVPSDTFTTSWNVNIPGTIGSTTAFAGFTGATGGLTATQDILTWTFNSSASQPPPPPTQYEAESVPAVGVPDARVFSWSGFTNGVGISVDATQVGNYIAFTLNVPQAGTYDVKYASKLHPLRGIGQLSVGGINVGPAVDQYNANSNGVWKEFDVGNVSFTAPGNYQFKFTVTGKNASSSGYYLTFDYIKLTPH